MSGAEIISLISSVITLIDASIKIYKIVDDASSLPPSFQDVAARLPLVQDTLTLASQGLKTDDAPDQSREALKTALTACVGKAVALRDIFRLVIPLAGSSRAARYVAALKTLPKAAKVEDLMLGITVDLQILTANRAVKAATRTQIEGLIAELRRPKARDTAISFHNYSSGSQNVFTGRGNQNVVSNGATQINGNFIGGTFNLSQMK